MPTASRRGAWVAGACFQRLILCTSIRSSSKWETSVIRSVRYLGRRTNTENLEQNATFALNSIPSVLAKEWRMRSGTSLPQSIAPTPGLSASVARRNGKRRRHFINDFYVFSGRAAITSTVAHFVQQVFPVFVGHISNAVHGLAPPIADLFFASHTLRTSRQCSSEQVGIKSLYEIKGWPTCPNCQPGAW